VKFVLILSVLLVSGCQSIIDNSQKLSNQVIDLDESIEYVDESNLWNYIASHQEIHIEDHPRILEHIDWFKQHPDYLTRISERAQPYLYLVVSEVEKEGLPIEIALLPIVESDYYPFSFSRHCSRSVAVYTFNWKALWVRSGLVVRGQKGRFSLD